MVIIIKINLVAWPVILFYLFIYNFSLSLSLCEIS